MANARLLANALRRALPDIPEESSQELASPVWVESDTATDDLELDQRVIEVLRQKVPRLSEIKGGVCPVDLGGWGADGRRKLEEFVVFCDQGGFYID